MSHVPACHLRNICRGVSALRVARFKHNFSENAMAPSVHGTVITTKAQIGQSGSQGLEYEKRQWTFPWLLCGVSQPRPGTCDLAGLRCSAAGVWTIAGAKTGTEIAQLARPDPAPYPDM